MSADLNEVQEQSKDSGSTTNRFSQAWTNSLLQIRRPVNSCLLQISSFAARHPKAVVTSTILASLTILGIGLFTNFHVETDSDRLWTPTPSAVLSHGKWLTDEAGFPTAPRPALMTIHANGKSVLGRDGMERVFAALDAVRQSSGYNEVCDKAEVSMTDLNGDTTCSITSVTRFWNYDFETFRGTANNDADVIQVVSEEVYPDGTPVDELSIFGYPTRDENGLLTSAKMYIINVAFPRIDESFELERTIIDNVLKLRDEWDTEDGNVFRLEFFAQRSFDDEFERAIVKDIPLVPLIFIVMSIFTCLIFYRRSWVDSRTMLGFGAVATVLLSIIFGYGIMFTIGVPFTSMSQVLPFIMFGIGLDDAFILWGAYQRTDRTKDSAERVHDTIEDVGISIFLTTVTSIVAFSLGTISSIPAVYWLCQYATPTIAIDFLFQLTFFVALIILDERRVEKKRRDCLVCFAAPIIDDDGEVSETEERNEGSSVPINRGTIFDRFMKRFGMFLMMPLVKVVVIFIFCGAFGFFAYRATLLRQEFDFTDVLPSPSYAGDFWSTFTTFAAVSGVSPYVVFRDINQGDPQIQDQMETYVNELVNIESISNQPTYFWLRDFQQFVSSSGDTSLITSPFNDQLEAFLSDPTYWQLYKDDIVRDSEGYVLASRTQIRMDQLDQEDVVQQVDALSDQRKVSESSGLNKDTKDHDWSLFTFDDLYYIWQFYTECPAELLLSTILGISSVSLIALIFIPHFSAILFIAPLISMLYIDLLGFLQLCGVAINAVSYISLVMSIGLMVDFIMHILLRYYESKEVTREGKVKDTLEEMGTSILIGAISTFLGVIPLALSTSNIFSTIFITFLGLVVLGAFHGLIFLPVVLSLVGPTVVLDLSRNGSQDEADEEGNDIENVSAVVHSV